MSDRNRDPVSQMTDLRGALVTIVPSLLACVDMVIASNSSGVTAEALLYDYREAANPLGQRLISRVPYQDWGAELHQAPETAIIPLDLSEALGCEGPATSPSLLANFVHILPNQAIETTAIATSQIFYVLRGQGVTRVADQEIAWTEGCCLALPADAIATHYAQTDSAFYWVHDAPLLRYLGVKPDRARFQPTLYRRQDLEQTLAAIAADPKSKKANRLSVLLANQNFPQTRTITHTIWAMFGLLPPDVVQAPHRHQSVALDLILDCQPGCYTLVGTQLDEHGQIRNPVRVDWRPYSVFVTPPGYWHAHYNESGHEAHLLPIQDAGLHTYLRTLDILFARSNGQISDEAA
ncbi:cupin [Synechococcus elongatus IITB4]|uniref:cupin n=1 Tax=Synechococcus elongatus TaxID=32046 RepID=UPI0030D23D1B